MSDIVKLPNTKKLESFLLDFEKVKNTYYKEEKEYTPPPVNISVLKRAKSKIGFNFESKQVIVKLLSNLTPSGFKNALRYIRDNSSDEFVKNEYGEAVSLNETIKEWNKDFTGKKNAKECWHLCFSINESPTNKNLYALEESVKDLMQKNFPHHKFVYVIHTHQSRPHVHVLLNKNNQFTRKKLHFNGRNEIRDFFNTLRNDFKDGLNLYGNLNYHNAYKYEKNNILEHNLDSMRYNKSNQLNIVTHLEKSVDKINKKYEHYKTKIESTNTKLDSIQKEKDTLIAKLRDCRNNMAQAIESMQKDIYDKEAYKKLKENQALYHETKDIVIAINKNLRKTKKRIKYYTKESKKLESASKNLEYKMNKSKEDYDRKQQDYYLDIKEKKAYIEYLQKHKYTISKIQSNVLESLIREINMHERANRENIQDSIKIESKKLESILNTSLGLKTSSKALIRAKKNMDYFYNILKSMNRYGLQDKGIKEDSYDYYFLLLKENSITINHILHKKLDYLTKTFENQSECKKYDIKTLKYMQKELDSLIHYMRKDNADYTQHNEGYLKDFENKNKLKILNEIESKTTQHISDYYTLLQLKAKEIIQRETKERELRELESKQRQKEIIQQREKQKDSNTQNTNIESTHTQTNTNNNNKGFSR